MYRMVIADDEFYIRDGLCRMDWARFGIEVAACCQNGAQAAKYIYEHPVDILLTDIKMPILSGLELIQDIGERFPSIKTVALTAYDDFDYIRTCLRSGTVDYVLKPFSEETLAKTFTTVCAILDKEAQQREHIAELERSNRLKTLALRREWMGRIFRENMSDERMEEISTYCEIFLESPVFFLCVVALDAPEGLSADDRELTVFSFRNAMEELCDDEATYDYIDDETAACYFLKGCAQRPGEAEQQQMAQAILRTLYRLRGVFRCTLSFAAAVTDDKHKIAGCTALLEGCLRQAGAGSGRVFTPEEMACPAAAGPGEEHGEEGTPDDNRRHLIRMVEAYIHENYNKPITLQAAADSVYVSQSYLSRVFKAETGQNFVKYLTDYRIREACRLLRETNRRVCDIVHMVGYDSPKYFCEVFKRAVGTTPNAYREGGGQG